MSVRAGRSSATAVVTATAAEPGGCRCRGHGGHGAHGGRRPPEGSPGHGNHGAHGGPCPPRARDGSSPGHCGRGGHGGPCPPGPVTKARRVTAVTAGAVITEVTGHGPAQSLRRRWARAHRAGVTTGKGHGGHCQHGGHGRHGSLGHRAERPGRAEPDDSCDHCAHGDHGGHCGHGAVTALTGRSRRVTAIREGPSDGRGAWRRAHTAQRSRERAAEREEPAAAGRNRPHHTTRAGGRAKNRTKRNAITHLSPESRGAVFFV